MTPERYSEQQAELDDHHQELAQQEHVDDDNKVQGPPEPGEHRGRDSDPR
ncbi:hypothetical protein [Mobilicoccus caccae]|uniref:Uncharacterized protein n=1 Tax=Mobilicoccus caccae TaxID=1859295 RepID=A0ABQ6IW96_9MICO|nr:hypothetical protein [Mobilicoccus caccae]GMA42215.1 hypothetical protein GCM10025883_42600 [Mobilicoccus caccae]